MCNDRTLCYLPLHDCLTRCCRCPGALAIAVLLPIGVVVGVGILMSMTMTVFVSVCAAYGTLP